mmetsp:Transcript_6504/g.19284  ORF Transcript_6504/g.19284 Transcript_6504/m.19284 type:complete len:233 (+) Transcript_6504:1274-1972(+)
MVRATPVGRNGLDDVPCPTALWRVCHRWHERGKCRRAGGCTRYTALGKTHPRGLAPRRILRAKRCGASCPAQQARHTWPRLLFGRLRPHRNPTELCRPCERLPVAIPPRATSAHPLCRAWQRRIARSAATWQGSMVGSTVRALENLACHARRCHSTAAQPEYSHAIRRVGRRCQQQPTASASPQASCRALHGALQPPAPACPFCAPFCTALQAEEVGHATGRRQSASQEQER